jgi:hypothetical protein
MMAELRALFVLTFFSLLKLGTGTSDSDVNLHCTSGVGGFELS